MDWEGEQNTQSRGELRGIQSGIVYIGGELLVSMEGWEDSDWLTRLAGKAYRDNSRDQGPTQIWAIYRTSTNSHSPPVKSECGSPLPHKSAEQNRDHSLSFPQGKIYSSYSNTFNGK